MNLDVSVYGLDRLILMKLAKPKTVTVNITSNIPIATHATTGSGQADESTFCRSFESEMQKEVTRVFHGIYATTTTRTNGHRN